MVEAHTTVALLSEIRGRPAHFAWRIAIDEEFAPSESPEVVNDKAGRLRLLSVGRLVPLKGLPLLLRALAAMNGKLQFNLRIVGGGPERARLESMATKSGIREDVEFVGSIPRNQMRRELSAADVFVFTSLRDSCGMALLEAMAAGLPAVCIDHGGPGILASRESAIMIAPRSEEHVVEKLADAVRLLGGHPELRRSMGLAAQERVRRLFLWDRLGDRMRPVFESLGRRRKTP